MPVVTRVLYRHWAVGALQIATDTLQLEQVTTLGNKRLCAISAGDQMSLCVTADGSLCDWGVAESLGMLGDLPDASEYYDDAHDEYDDGEGERSRLVST